ncbi:glutamate synthase-related protein [Pseudactinotalea sp.]|uniref:glutamate synthase-related protein n=1 Tax=Pseudactinotalea sp. TaxID=1926260 RepID=UPI003B3ABA99
MDLRRATLHNPDTEYSDCGVGFITRKDGRPTHDVILKGDEALCAIPHRGGRSSEGVGDGAGVSVDLSVEFFSAITGEALEAGRFGVGNFFMPTDESAWPAARELVDATLAQVGVQVLTVRDVPVDHEVIRRISRSYQLPVVQWVFRAPPGWDRADLDRAANDALLRIESAAFSDQELDGLYPLSLSARTQVLKGRLNSGEVISYFTDLVDDRHSVRTLYFHTRFSTNTEPHPSMAQPFRMMAHNGELNTDRKNRLSDEALATSRQRSIVRPPGQSDSSRLDQTLQSRVFDDGLGLLEAVVSLMPPAWENDRTLPATVRDMLEYFSLYEEKNDGPAALIFSDGDIVGARLDRLGLRPLRTIETDTYLMVSSEAGQVDFPAQEVTHRGRIEAGGMLYLDHRTGVIHRTAEALNVLAERRDFGALLQRARVNLADLDVGRLERGATTLGYDGDLPLAARYVAYSLNSESFRFMMDPMLASGAERISAMGYGNAINALSDTEGGMAKYFSQRFAQVTNPSLDSIREADGMSTHVALGAKPGSGTDMTQIVVPSPILGHLEMLRLREQQVTPLQRFDMLYAPAPGDAEANAAAMRAALSTLCDEVEAFALTSGGIAVVSDRSISRTRAPLPLPLALAAVNRRLIETGLRLRVSIVAESGQLPSSHHIAVALGFGASAVYSIAARLRAEQKYPAPPAPAETVTETDLAVEKYRKAALKSLAKTMGRVGLCTVESYIGGEFFEPNYLDTRDDVLAQCFPHMDAPVGGVGFARIASATTAWHTRALDVTEESQIPLLGLFKERAEGAGHSYGTVVVRGFGEMTEEKVGFAPEDSDPALRLQTLRGLDDAFGLTDEAYQHTGYDALTDDEIDAFTITPGYRDFVADTRAERARRPSALRDVLTFPADVTGLRTAAEFAAELDRFALEGNASVLVRGLEINETERITPEASTAVGQDEATGTFTLWFTDVSGPQPARYEALVRAFVGTYPHEVHGHEIAGGELTVTVSGRTARFLRLLRPAPAELPLEQVQAAHEITRTLTSGAMSHGALVASAHEAVAHGTNMAGGLSNCGEGGEHITRYGTIRGSRIKQFASGRFGIWAGYLADPMLQELEIKIGQGAKPGEGGQLPAPKVTVEIAAARGGTPGVELVSPPPHHDTYSIEDLAQLIHDCKAARVRVIVKLVSSEGIGTIAVGVAKAGADVINVAGNTGGTGAAPVTSLKYAGRSAEIGVAEVHQALTANGLRQKVTLRCSGAHQTGRDVVISALLGADSFEFGTTALMMLKCVMAKNCNIKCPAGLTTNPEAFDGDPRALAQFLLNVAHDVRELLSRLGLSSLREARGRGDLLQLLEHPAAVGKLDVRRMLAPVAEKVVDDPIYLEKDFAVDDALIEQLRAALVDGRREQVVLDAGRLHNPNKTVGGQVAIDVERLLNYELDADTLAAMPAVAGDERGRHYLLPDSAQVTSTGSAGQSFGAFCNDGLSLIHTGTANDGVGKSAGGGQIVVRTPGGGSPLPGGNVLIGNFALFGATGGRLFVQGEAGDRFAVRNSGATAVVEGVGEFGCEYMTNGAVLNLGGAGKGLGNGMSGGFVYQYDPDGSVAARVSEDSLLMLPLTDSEHGPFHELAVRTMLEWHLEATGSALAGRLLQDWSRTREHMVIGMPRALLLYQDADAIAANKPRKELLEELGTAIAADKLRDYKEHYRDGQAVAGGRVPVIGGTDVSDMYGLLSAYTVLSAAQEVALDRVSGATAIDDPRVVEAARKLVLTEDFFVMQRLVKYVRNQLEVFEDHELATLVAGKRLDDYRRSLQLRNVRGIDAPGTYGWILYQQRKNDRRSRTARFDEMLARAALGDLATLAADLTSEVVVP